MSFDRVCKALTRDPWHLTLAEVGELTPYQVKNVYFRPDRRDEGAPSYARVKDAFFKMQTEWHGKTEAEAEELWRAEVARTSAPPGVG